MSEALRFLLLSELIGLAALPLAAFALGRLPGGAAAFAKPLGLLAAAYPVWLLASAGVVPYGTGTAVAGVVVLGLAGAWLWRRHGDPLGDRRLALAAEAVFVAAFAGGALLAAYSPDVRGTEKPMDMAFLTAINASGDMPPHDPWMAGEELNYYYLGHYLMAFVVRLTGVAPSAGYNLSLALTFALSAVAAFGLGAALTAAAGGRRRVLAGVLAACLVCGAGTLDSGIELFREGGPLRAYDWFGPSRAIPQAITEFPAFAFLLGDLHAHLLAVPFTLLALAFGLQAARGGPSRRDVVPAGIAVGVLYAINSWSYPVAAGIVALSALVWLRGRPRPGAWRAAALWSVGVLWISVLAVLPFWLTFDAATGGIGVVEERRSFSQFVGDQSLFLGVLLWILLAAFARLLLATGRPLRTAAWVGVAAIVAGSLLAPADLAGPALMAALVAVAACAAWDAEEAAERWGWLVIAAGLACVLGPELVYVRDEFEGSDLFRMNTIFKLGFQAWILLALMAAVVFPLGRRWLPAGAWRLWAPVAVVGLALAAIYPFAGTYSRKAAFADGPRLSGLAWLERDAPGDVAAIGWLRDEAAGDAVVLEAVGDDYSEFGHARISTFSGRATVLGWPGHELQWGHDVGSRRADVERMYRDPDPAAVRPLLERYGVDYVVAGPLERADYGDDGLAKFDRLGRRVLDRDGTTVWRLNPT